MECSFHTADAWVPRIGQSSYSHHKRVSSHCDPISHTHLRMTFISQLRRDIPTEFASFWSMFDNVATLPRQGSCAQLISVSLCPSNHSSFCASHSRTTFQRQSQPLTIVFHMATKHPDDVSIFIQFGGCFFAGRRGRRTPSFASQAIKHAHVDGTFASNMLRWRRSRPAPCRHAQIMVHALPLFARSFCQTFRK